MLRRNYLGGLLLTFICYLGSVVSAQARDVSLQWNANTESDLAGYKVYYQAGSATTPFSGTPVNVNKQTTATITGLDPAKTYYFTVTAYNTAGKESSYSNIVNVAATSTPPPAPSGSISTIWPSTAVPAVADAGADNPVELGVKFRSDTAGTITGIRFYKSIANAGNHKVNLWSSTGQLLATATATSETASGWQQVNFATPVAITANTTYVASYFVPKGHYSYNQNYLTNGVDYAPLHVPANGGVYSYGSSSTFPTQVHLASNYWVDVAFKANTSSSDTTKPTVNITYPVNSIISGTTPVSISASDNVGVTKVELSINGAVKYTGTASPYSYSWNTTTVANGNYTLVAKAYDAAGNVQSATKTVTVSNQVADSQAPTASITSPANNSSASGTVSVNMSASDNVRVTKLELYANGVLKYTAAAASGTFSWDTTKQTNGQVTLVAKAYDAAGNVGQSANVFVTVNNTTSTPTATTYSLWSSTVPAVVDGGADNPVTLGTKFRSNVKGYITGIRFYKSLANTGTHVAALWSGSGQLLASANFVNETASGWQRVTFSTPVAIAANTTYVASYFCPRGHYSYNYNYLTSGVTKSPLSVPANGGVYTYASSSKFPTQVYNSSNYWVDVIFKP